LTPLGERGQCRRVGNDQKGRLDMKTVAAFTAVALSAAIAAPSANADAVSDFYSKNNLTLVIGYVPGGGADTFARFLARHLGKHIPGNPSVIVQNMPGAGGINALNHFYRVGAQDGSRTILTSSTHILAQLLGEKNVRYEIDKIKWLGTLTQDTAGCVVSGKSGIKSVTEARDRRMIFGATGATSASNHHPLLMRELLGYRIEMVTGYSGTGMARLAVKNGEVDAVCSFWASEAQGPLSGELKSGELVPIVQLGTRPHPAFGKAPVIYDLARNDEDRLIMRAVLKATELTRPYGTAPGTPDDRVAALRDGFWATVNSPELQADAKRLGLIIDPLDWKDTVAELDKIFETPKDVIARVKKVIGVE
jgi:tripartite-type tricarboxylate transporter receptor subunit TctC